MDQSSAQTIRIVVPPNLARAEIGALADQSIEQFAQRDVAEIQIDVSRVEEPDVAYMDALARLHLAARRHGADVRLVGPCPRLVDLIQLVGLEGILLDDADGSTG